MLVLAVSGCHPAVDLAFPPDGGVIDTPGMPVIAHTDRDALDATWTTALDGVDVTDPWAVLRSAKGHGIDDGTDDIGWLDLDGVPDGEHELVVTADRPGWHATARGRFVVATGANRVDLHVVDGDGSPVAARIVVLGDDGSPFAWPEAIDQRARDHGASVFTMDGEAHVDLDDGRWRILGVRGIRDDVADVTIDLSGPADVVLVVPRVIDLPDAAGDLHVHTARSGDAFVPDRLRFASLAATGLDVLAITDHGKVASVGGFFPDPDEGGPLVIDGIESDVGAGESDGHLLAFPQVSAPVDAGADVAGWLDALRGSGAEVVQLAHPRGIEFAPGEGLKHTHALLHDRGYQPGEPLDSAENAWLLAPNAAGTRPLDLDALEVINRFSVEGWLEVRTDWFSWLNQGHFVTGTGNSDSHAADLERAGLPTNLVRCDPCDVPGFARAVKAGRVRVSTGPIVDVRVGDAGPGDLVTSAAPVAMITVRAASWVPVDELRMVVDGEVVRAEPVPDVRDARGVLDYAVAWPVPLDEDGWVLVEAGIPIDDRPGTRVVPRPGLYGLVAPEYLPIAFTNPVRVDVDGDGAWR
jgi:hypothetical protein